MTTYTLTPRFRASWPHLLKKRKNDLSGKEEYSVTAIFPLNADLAPLKAAANTAMEKKFGTDRSKWPKSPRSPFRKCKEKWKEKDGKMVIPPGFEDGEAVWINFHTEETPDVRDQRAMVVTEERQIYSGCWCIAHINASAYTHGQGGVSLYLNGIQKVADGDPLGGRPDISSAFKPVEGASAPESAEDVFA